MNWLWILIAVWFFMQAIRLVVAVKEPDYSKITYVVAGLIVLAIIIFGAWR